MKLEIVDINKSFNDFHVLHDINFSIKSGQIFGYLGRNGAGKTTSIRILMDVFGADSGKILMDGNPFDAKKYKIGYLPEERGMYAKNTVKEQLIYFAMLRGASRKEALASVGHWTNKFEINQYLDKKLETLSKGNQQKVQITQAFLNNPDILILDEPFSGLDPVNSQIFQDALREYIDKDRIIIFSSHQMSYVETFCDDIAIIDKGKIVLQGQLEKIKQKLGNNRVVVKSGNFTNAALIEILNTLDYRALEILEYVVVETKEDTKKEKIFNDLVAKGVDISMFSDYQPSLQEIFINTVGENHE